LNPQLQAITFEGNFVGELGVDNRTSEIARLKAVALEFHRELDAETRAHLEKNMKMKNLN